MPRLVTYFQICYGYHILSAKLENARLILHAFSCPVANQVSSGRPQAVILVPLKPFSLLGLPAFKENMVVLRLGYVGVHIAAVAPSSHPIHQHNPAWQGNMLRHKLRGVTYGIGQWYAARWCQVTTLTIGLAAPMAAEQTPQSESGG